MLVLSRKVGEEIVIDGTIRVVVLEAHRDRVRLGVAAPANVRIDREEVRERRNREASVEPLMALHALESGQPEFIGS